MAIDSLTKEQSAFLEEFVLDKTLSPDGEDKRYPGLLKAALGLSERIGKMSSDAKALLQAQTGELDGKLAEAQSQAKDGDSGRAAETLNSAAPIMRDLRQDMQLASSYAEEAGKFQARLKEARSRQGGDGGIAIADYIERLDLDDERRSAAESRGDLRMALTACEAMDNIHAAKMQDADRGREFLNLQTGIETDIARLEHSAPADEGAAEVISEVREMMNDASNFTKSDNWVGAVIMMRNARNEFKVGIATLDLKQNLATDDSDADFDTSEKGFQALFKGISGMRGANTFSRQLRDAHALASSARTLMPDTRAARNQLAEATRQCQDLLHPIRTQARYQAVARSALAQHKFLGQQNTDSCVKAEIRQSAQLIKQAAGQAKSEDFDAALETLKKAEGKISDGLQASQIYSSDIKGARMAIVGTLKAQPDHDESDQLRQLFDQISKAYDQRDFAASARYSAQVHEICEKA